MKREEAVKFLIENPSELGRMVGFTKLTKLHNDWIRSMVIGKEDETLQAHRGSYKTTCVSVALATICLLFPNLKSMFMRKTDNDVKEVIKQTQKILKDQHMQYFAKSIYGVHIRLLTESATEINTNLAVNDPRGTSQLVGFGLGASLTGKHFDRIFTDDIVNLSDRLSKADRERTKIIYQELQNVRNDNGRIFNTGTPWHKDDAFSIMPAAKKYDCYSTGLLDEEKIADLKSKMLPSLFAANYELRHIASEDVIFERPNVSGDPAMVEQGICHIDAAYYGEDYTAFTIASRIEDTVYVFGKLWRKHVDDVVDEIVKLRKAFNAGRIYCEDNGDKGYLAKELRKKGELVGLYHESMNKYLKIVTYLKESWQNVIFVVGTDQEYIEQICEYNENAEHDDAADSLASLLRRMWGKKTETKYVPMLG